MSIGEMGTGGGGEGGVIGAELVEDQGHELSWQRLHHSLSIQYIKYIIFQYM